MDNGFILMIAYYRNREEEQDAMCFVYRPEDGDRESAFLRFYNAQHDLLNAEDIIGVYPVGTKGYEEKDADGNEYVITVNKI